MGPEHQDVREQPTSRFVRLSYDSGRLVVNMNASGPAPFMPAPASRIDWLVACAGRLWRQRRRCLAALLVLHAPTGRWTVRLPRQRCSPAGVSWTVVADDFAGLAPDWVLGGTFQAAARGPQDFEPLAEVIPPADGLHFVLLLGDGLADLRAFVRAGGELRPAGEQPVMVNDWAAVLDAAKPRLTLA